MRYQAQTFIKQVQIDLLALSDADLFQTIDQWGPGKESSGLSHDAPEVTWSALGYTRAPAEAEHFSCPPGTEPGVEPEVREHWLAPSPHQPIAFQSLHATYPEWGDGSTFNAHLANHLRWMRMNRRRNDQSTSMTPHV